MGRGCPRMSISCKSRATRSSSMSEGPGSRIIVDAVHTGSIVPDRPGLNSVVWRQAKVATYRYWCVPRLHLDPQGRRTLNKVVACPYGAALSTVAPSSCFEGLPARLPPAAVRLAVLLLRTAGTDCRGHTNPPPHSGVSPSSTALPSGAAPSAVASMVGAPFPQVGVSITTLAEVVLVPHVTAIFLRFIALDLAVELFC